MFQVVTWKIGKFYDSRMNKDNIQGSSINGLYRLYRDTQSDNFSYISCIVKLIFYPNPNNPIRLNNRFIKTTQNSSVTLRDRDNVGNVAKSYLPFIFLKR